ncbi:hypothetical protein MCNS_31150 [Mycobacterium conspicuum]|uniref:Uncharacterized protein n=1 Tax=Mycobacterium conspicuum TaxID=44010 RepID=A0A7I7YG21_9MYCO|nr:hypothetical protein MCNS_31150 [Mycobacterium conspicuum]
MIPQRGPADLPFVDKPRRCSIEDQGRVGVERVAGTGVDIEQDFAGRELARGPGFPAGLRAFQYNSAGGSQTVAEKLVSDSRSILHT